MYKRPSRMQNYAGLDRIWAPFRYYEDKIAVARKHGFLSWYEFIVEAYAQLQSCYKIAAITGMSVAGIRETVRKFGIETAGAGTGWYDRRGKKRRWR